MKKLISMTDFVLEKWNEDLFLDEYTKVTHNYANFLKQPLKLEMFVPCVDNEPFNYSKHGNAEQYQKAKEKVLFEGFVFTESQKYSVINKIDLSVSPYGINNERLQITKITKGKFHTWLQLFTTEDLIQCNLKLTANALKQIGL